MRPQLTVIRTWCASSAVRRFFSFPATRRDVAIALLCAFVTLLLLAAGGVQART